MKEKLIEIGKILLYIIVIDFVVISGYAFYAGIYNGTEQEFQALLNRGYVTGCASSTQRGNPWINYDRDLAIFSTSLPEKLLYNYKFLEGKYIPRKFNALIEEKIKQECNKNK